MVDKVKVLYYVDILLAGGIQSFIFDSIKQFDKSKIQVDILILDDIKQHDVELKLIDMGISIFRLKGVWLDRPWDFLKQSRALELFFSEHHDYKIVHLHASSKNFLVLQKAKKFGIPIRIAHSHNTRFQTFNKISVFIGNVLKNRLRRVSTDFFACSDIAGIWLFGKKILKHERFCIIPNAIDVERFVYNENKRLHIREKLNLDGKLVIGNVGRFVPQKNHRFLLEIFSEISKKKDNAHLVLVGDGEEFDAIKALAIDMNLNKKITFLGYREDRNEILNCFDLFVCPSLFEGFGIVLIEAQANGLPCFATAVKIPESAKVTELLTFISLDLPAETWADMILCTDFTRKNCAEEIIRAGYDSKSASKILENFYLHVEDGGK